MRFLKLETRNFRQYRELEIDLVGTSNFSIIQANIGIGKTTFTNAILWCLYGIEQLDKKKDLEAIPNESSMQRANGGPVEVVVTLKLELDDENKSVATIRRTQQFITTEGIPVAIGEANLRVSHLKDVTAGAEIVENPQVWINRLLPRKLYPYFIFNGEESANYFAESPQQEIRDTILRIARVDVLQRMKSHLQKVADDIRSEMKRSDPGNLESADGEVQLRREALSRSEEAIKELEQTLRNFDIENANLKDRVEKGGAVKKLMDELSVINSDLAVLREQQKAEEDKLALWAAINAQYYFGAQALLDMQAVIQAAKEEGSFPPAFKPESLLSLINNRKCICGQSLHGQSESLNHIEKLIDEYRIAGPRGAELQKLEVHLSNFLERQRDAEDSYRSLISVIKSYRDDIDIANGRAEEIKLQVGDEGQSNDVQIFELLLDQLNARNASATALALLRADFEEEKRLLANAEAEYERVLRKSGVAAALKNQYEFLNESIAEILKVSDRIMSGVLEQVRAELNNNFQSWHSKDNPEEIHLDEDFVITKIGNFGQSTSFSKGEYRLLYYALCFAARTVSGFNLPLIVDSPWGNMDNTTRKDLAGVMAESTTERQTVILVLDSEYPAEIAQIMASGRPRHFAIKMQSGAVDKYSEIVEVK